MKIQTFRERLMSDKDFAISYIVANNEVAVAEQIRALGYSVNTTDDIFALLNHMLTEGKMDEFRQSLSVPMRTEGVDPAQMAVVMEVAQGMRQMASEDGSTKMQPYNNYGIPGTDITSDGGAVPSSSASASGSGGGSNWGANFSNAFGALVGGFTTMWTAGVFAGDRTVTNVPTDEAAQAASEEERKRKAAKNRTIMIVVGVLVLLVLAFLIYKATKGSK